MGKGRREGRIGRGEGKETLKDIVEGDSEE